jgi:hypothetical protein
VDDDARGAAAVAMALLLRAALALLVAIISTASGGSNGTALGGRSPPLVVDGAQHAPRKLVVFYNGWRLLDKCDPSNGGATCVVNEGKCRQMVALGFNVAVVMIYTPASALRGLALCGMAPWVNVGNNLHACGEEEGAALRPRPYPNCCSTVNEPEPADYRSFCRAHIGSPFLNSSAYMVRVKNATDTLRQSGGWAAGALDDIEQPPWPARSWSAAGEPRVYNFSDLEERLGNRPSASAPQWPSFADWPAKDAHRPPAGRALSIEDLQFNDPQLIETAQPQHVGGGTNLSILIAGQSNISMVSQPFQLGVLDHTHVTRVDIWLQRSAPVYPAAWLSISICEVNAKDGSPVLERAVLCVSRSQPNPNYPEYFRSAGIWATCGVNPSDLPANTTGQSQAHASPTSVYVNPTKALDPTRTYALVVQFADHSHSVLAGSPASYVVEAVRHPSLRKKGLEAMVYEESAGWRAMPGVALRTRLWAPGDATNPNGLHADWVAFHASTTALELKLFADVARTLPTHNSTGRTMDVVAYSSYAGIGMGTSINAYLGDVRDTYGVDWANLAQAGLTVSMCGYGAQDIRPTRAALAAGARAASPPTLKPPLVVCSCKSSQDVFTKEYELCDGAMEFESEGGATPFNHDFNFHVPNHSLASDGRPA